MLKQLVASYSINRTNSSVPNGIPEVAVARWTMLALASIVLLAAFLRFYAITEDIGTNLILTGTCDQPFVDETQPLLTKNLLQFDVFFYPPVAPLLTAMAALPFMAIAPEHFSLGVFCRCLSNVIGIATVIVVYFIGKEWSRLIGLLAAGLYAVTMIAVISTANVQVYSALFVLLGIYYFFKSIRNPSKTSVILVGVFLGLGIATKYFPLTLILMLFLIHFIVDADEGHSAEANAMTLKQKKYFDIIWNGSCFCLFVMCATTLYIALFDDQIVTGALRQIYNSSSHEHPFDYHWPIIRQIYYAALVGVVGLWLLISMGILVPYTRRVSPYEWLSKIYRSHWRWILPCGGMAVTLLVTIGIPVLLNLNNFIRYAAWVVSTVSGSGDGGMFPVGSPAPRYFLSFFPENLGIPLFTLACAGIIWSLWGRDQKGMLLLLIMFPMYLLLERSSVKVNRYALELMPVFCIFAAIFLVRFSQLRLHRMLRFAPMALSTVVFAYSTFYTLAWINAMRPQPDVRVETVEWVRHNVSPGTRIGMKTQLWVEGSHELIPNVNEMKEYLITSYADHPDYIIFPKLLHAIIRQYDDLSQTGYHYTAKDWAPQAQPGLEELATLVNIVTQTEYDLVQEFEKKPEVLGISFGQQSLSGATWFIEHSGSYGIQIYRRHGLGPDLAENIQAKG